MRLTPKKTEIIRSAARQVFGAGARVYLFGSRTDDAGRSGAIEAGWPVPWSRTPLSKRGPKTSRRSSTGFKICLEINFFQDCFPGLARNQRHSLTRFGRRKSWGLSSPPDWLLARELRNKLVHEYVADPQEFADALNTARRLGTDLIESFSGVKDYVKRHRDV